MVTKILEDYMKTTAVAVLRVAEFVEKLRTERGGISSPEEAAAISVAMYGAPPKPPAGNVASIISPPHKRKRLVVEDKSMADDVVMLMSVARYGIENNRSRAEDAVKNIGKIMKEITIAPDTPDKVFVGLDDNDTPLVDCPKYQLRGEKKITLASFQLPNVIDSVEKSLKDILSKVQNPEASNLLKTYILIVAQNVNIMNSIISWADSVERALKEYERQARLTPPPSLPLLMTSRHITEVNIAVGDIMRLVGKSYGRTVTQLTSARDISEFQKATDTCYAALMAETHVRIASNLLFYVNFKIVEGNEKEYVKNRLGAMAGTVKEPISIERRDATETLFGLCFMFKIMPPEFVDSVFTFPSTAKLSYYSGCSETQPLTQTRPPLTLLLSRYGPSFENSWARFRNVLTERSKEVSKSHDKGSRIDYVDATANLTGLVYVLVLDLANAFQAQRACAYKFLNKLKEQYRLWDKFVKAS